jgi:predicted outer membrane repeat protein
MQDRRTRGPRTTAHLVAAVFVLVGTAIPHGRASAADFVVTNLAGSGAGSLRAAIQAANANGAGVDQITFAPGVTGTIALGGTQLDITGSVSIFGPGSDLLTIDAGGASRVMSTFTPGVSLVLQGLTLRNGDTAGPGGAVAFFDGDELFVSDVRMIDNASGDEGGALAFGGVDGLIGIEDAVFQGNTADSNGGAIAGSTDASIGSVYVDRTVIDGNTTTTGNGGGLVLDAPERSVFITDLDVSGNSAPVGDTGGALVFGRFVEVEATSVTGNSSVGGVGGIEVASTAVNLNIRDVTITDNDASGGRGGASFSSADVLSVTNASVEGNSGLNVGGMAATAAGAVNIRQSTVTGNSAVATAGGIFVTSSDSLRIERTTVAGNSAADHPGVYAITTPAVVIDRSTVSGNIAGGGSDGAGIFVGGPAGTARIVSSTVSGNTTTGAGGGVFVDGIDLAIAHSTITANTADEGGGIARTGPEDLTIDHTIVAGNEVPDVADAPDVAGAASADHSLVGDTTGATITGAGNLLDLDPDLGPLGDHGGPTHTHIPALGSAAIDAGEQAIALPPATDQRGFARVDGTIDIGAVETRPADHPTAAGAARFIGLEPARLFDSRPGLAPGTGPKGRVGPDGSVDIVVLGRAGVPPTGVTAVVVNVTATDVAGPSFVAATPTPGGATAAPDVSTVNTPRSGLTRSNLAVVPVGDGGRIRLSSKEAAHVIVDVFGYYSVTDVAVRAGRMVPVGPHRVFDTRPGEPAPGPKGLVTDGGTIAPQVLGVGPVPAAGVAAVVINVTATQVAGPSYVTVWPDGPVVDTSSLNISESGETTANTVIVPVGDDGRIRLLTLRSAHLLGDVIAYVTDGTAPIDDTGLFVALEPDRLFDTRAGEQPAGAPKGMLDAGDEITVDMAGRAGLPADVGSILMNVTATQSTAGFVTVYPSMTVRPTASTVNPNPDGDTRANSTFAAVGTDGAVSFYTLSATHLLADTAGYTLP